MKRRKTEAIYELAEKVRKILELTTPIDLHTIIEKQLKGNCIYEELNDDISGKIVREGDSFKITINEKLSSGKRNFTIAHELGHLFLHMGFLLNDKKWKSSVEYIDSVYYRIGYSEEEYEASQFAGALLMPGYEFREFLEKNKTDENTVDITLIADHFNVSNDDALTRGRWLGWGI